MAVHFREKFHLRSIGALHSVVSTGWIEVNGKFVIGLA
jgi:hypothetical protein